MYTYNLPNIIPAGTVMNTTINSVAMQLENIISYAIQIVFTGIPTGSFKLQSSCDPIAETNLQPSPNGKITYSPTNWTDVANSTFSVAAAGNVEWNWALNAGYSFVRVVYTDTSGGTSTATITSARMNAKGV